ncbi:hypothetical protein FSARC_7682 [Fusarium sarcochroum]|uniref:DUF3669 domain-containing protein n=1 Tax=Fusarium sarcochroum TaxID=1208366 RepID=A0A8H4X743_9HYPO|nr:hypothetical protein FSARC_7682 [Fusarium sarcochroum]
MPSRVNRDLTTETSIEELTRIGAGCCGSVWADKNSSTNNDVASCIKREDGSSGRSLVNEHYIHQLVIQAIELNPQHATSFRVPLCRGFLHKHDDEDWSRVLPRLPPGSTACNALLSEKVQPVSEQARNLIVAKFAKAEGHDHDAIINDKKNEHCLIRPYLGRRKRDRGYTGRPTFFSLRNFPLYVNRMIELGLDVESYTKVMAEGLAFLHWVARIDANDVEFVLARPRPRTNSHPHSQFDTSILGPHSMWIIDFDCCDPITMDKEGVETAAQSFWRNDPYYPRPGSDNYFDQKLWAIFRVHFLQTSEGILENETPSSVRGLPSLLMDKIVEMGIKRAMI